MFTFINHLDSEMKSGLKKSEMHRISHASVFKAMKNDVTLIIINKNVRKTTSGKHTHFIKSTMFQFSDLHVVMSVNSANL